MNRDETLQYLADLGLVENYTRKLMYKEDLEDFDDFNQEIWLQLCEIPAQKWDDLWKQGTKTDSAKAVRGYVSGLIHRNVKSTNSKLWYKLKKHKKYEIPQATFDEEKENLLKDYN